MASVGKAAGAAGDEDTRRMAELLISVLREKAGLGGHEQQHPFSSWEDMEAAARVIEAGGALPEPREQFVRDPETAEQFKSRFDSLFTKESFKGIKHRNPGQDAAEGGRGDDDDDGAPDVEWRQPFDNVQVFNEELQGIVPVPYMPPADEARFAEVERIAYLLRRAHLEHRALGAGVAALATAGLLLGGPPPAARSAGGASGGAGFGECGAEEAAAAAAARREQRAGERLRFHDPWMWLEGPEEVAEYSRRLEAAGGELKLVHLMLRCASYDPHPSWEVVADLSLDLPYPLWYMKYIMLHPSLCGTLQRPPSLPAEDRSVPVDGWGESAGRQLRHELVPQRPTDGPEGRSVLPEEPYPRRPASPPSGEAAAGAAHLRWMRMRPWLGDGGGRNVLWLPQDPPQELDAWDPVARFLLSIGACGGDFGSGSSSSPQASWGTPDYSAVLCDDILDPTSWLGGPAMAAGIDPAVLSEHRRQRRAGKLEQEQQESAPWLWNPEQRRLQQRASAALRLLLGDDYEATMARMPQPGKRRGRGSNAPPPVAEQDGTSFLRGDRFTLNATLFYSLDWLAGCVDCVGLAFGAVHGAAAEPAEVADVYLAELGLLSWALEREAAAGRQAAQE